MWYKVNVNLEGKENVTEQNEENDWQHNYVNMGFFPIVRD